MTTQETHGQPGLFNEFTANTATGRRIEHRNLEYPGQVIIASHWDLGWTLPIPKQEDQHFRIVILTPDTSESIPAQQLQDSRIAVVFPAQLGEEATRAAVDFWAWQEMNGEYSEDKHPGKEGDDIRDWLAKQQVVLLSNLVQTHLRSYQNGTIITRDDLAIMAKEAFGLPGNDKRVLAITEPLLTAAYTSYRSSGLGSECFAPRAG